MSGGMHNPAPRLGRMPSRWRVHATPLLSVMIASMVPSLLPLISQSPTLPPLGLMLLISWRLLHHEMWPLWIGVPLGAFDDLMSGNAFGTGILLWSLILMAIEMADARLFWRDYWHDWLIAGLACLFFLTGGVMIAKIAGSLAPVLLVLPQLFWSVLFYPIIVRITAAIDRWRMMA